MKRVFRITLFFVLFLVLLFLVVNLIPDQFQNSYQRVLVRQYDYFKSINDTKLVFIGGSSLSFGLDIDTMENLTGRHCAILGNHAAYGLPYLLELSKANLNSGDIVVIEYCNCDVDKSDGAELIITGVGKRYDMYKFIPSCIKKSIIAAIPSAIKMNLDYWRSGEPYDPSVPYCINAYDERGNMTFYRPDPWLSEAYENGNKGNETLYYRDFFSLIRTMNFDLFEYINEYILWADSIGIKVLVTIQPAYDASIPDYCDDSIINRFDSIISENLKAPLVSKSQDYFFARKYMFDGYLHLNTSGAVLRSQKLYDDISNYL